MFVKQQQYKDKRTGRTKKSRKHSIFFNDHKGVERSIPGFRDKAASEELGRQVERLVALRAANMPPSSWKSFSSSSICLATSSEVSAISLF